MTITETDWDKVTALLRTVAALREPKWYPTRHPLHVIRYMSWMDAREAGLSWDDIGAVLGITAAQARISAGIT